jgi:hypothetical protein
MDCNEMRGARTVKIFKKKKAKVHSKKIAEEAGVGILTIGGCRRRPG